MFENIKIIGKKHQYKVNIVIIRLNLYSTFVTHTSFQNLPQIKAQLAYRTFLIQLIY